MSARAPWYPATMPLSDLRGQNAALKTLRRALEKDRLPNAYLFEGPSGVGKRTAALALSAARLCTVRPHEGCGECSTCHRVLSENHPDARLFRPRDEGNRNLQVEVLRSEILPVAQFAPFEGEHAFLIFPDADISFPEQHPVAANALLKTLEEPRPRVTFVLLAERAERLLITIRSRCQRVRFGPLPPLVLEQLLERAEVPSEQWPSAIALSEGRADRALLLAKEGLGNELFGRAERIDRTLSMRDLGRAVELAEELAKAPDLTLVLETLAAYYRDVAVLGLGLREQLRFTANSAALAERARELSAAAAAARADRLFRMPELFAKNANPQIALDQLFSELSELR